LSYFDWEDPLPPFDWDDAQPAAYRRNSMGAGMVWRVCTKGLRLGGMGWGGFARHICVEWWCIVWQRLLQGTRSCW
jgi:hypothetical protein